MSTRTGGIHRRATPADASGIRITQLLLGGTLLITGVIVFLTGHAERLEQLVWAMAVAFFATAAAISVPWRRLPLWASAALPLLDIIAITLLREGSPASGFTILYIFPALWSAWVWGLSGSIGATIAITALYWTTTMLDERREATPALLLLPIAVAAATAIAHVYAGRTTAQRGLLERQSLALRAGVERATREEALLAEVLDAVEFGVARLSAEGEVVFANAASTALMRARRSAGGDVYAADGVTRVDPADSPNLRARRGELFEGALAWYGAPGDERRALRTSSRALTSGQPGERLVITVDVTEEELALRAREDLVASVSHELRTPLTAILGYLELALDDDGLPDSARQSLVVAGRNADRLLELVTGILASPAYTRAGVELRIVPERFDFAELLAERLEELELRAREAGIAVDRGGVESARVYGDPYRLAQVIDNLVSNAIKYNRPGGRIELGLTEDGLHSWLVVRDTGAGVAPAELPRIFERFFRADAVRKTSTHGHGLGLAITRDIVRAHGGEITVRSEPGRGSTFVVRLPARDPRES